MPFDLSWFLFFFRFADGYSKDFEKQITHEREKSYKRVTTFGFTDLAPFARNAVECLVSDSFTQCFEVRSLHDTTNITNVE